MTIGLFVCLNGRIKQEVSSMFQIIINAMNAVYDAILDPTERAWDWCYKRVGIWAIFAPFLLLAFLVWGMVMLSYLLGAR